MECVHFPLPAVGCYLVRDRETTPTPGASSMEKSDEMKATVGYELRSPCAFVTYIDQIHVLPSNFSKPLAKTSRDPTGNGFIFLF